MKFNKRQPERKNTATVALPAQEEEPLAELDMREFEGKGLMERLQAKAYNSGLSMVTQLKAASQAEGLAKAIQNVESDLRRLRDFRFRVGFAGEQSAGKSMVINSLLDYPLSPTCALCTTATEVSISYGSFPRIRAIRCQDHKLLMDYDCRKVKPEIWEGLQDFVCKLCSVSPLENLIYFTDRYILKDTSDFTRDELQMDPNDPRQVAMLLLALLTVYIERDRSDTLGPMQATLYQKLGIPVDEEFNVEVEWNSELLSSGMVMVDLPGLGSASREKVKDGKVVSRAHDEITIEAINAMDAMVFLTNKEVSGEGLAAVRTMISKASIRAAGRSDIRIIPVINKCDWSGSFEAAANALLGIFNEMGIQKEEQDFIAYASIYCEATFTDFPFERTLFYRDWMDKNPAIAKMLPPDQIETTLRGMLQENYEKYNIPTLKNIFRSKCVEMGKYIRTLETLQSLRGVALMFVKRMETLMRAYKLSADASSQIGAELSWGVLDAVQTPINSALDNLGKKQNELGKTIKTSAEDLIREKIPDQFLECCGSSLLEYAQRLLKIVDRFELDLTGKKARIDKSGSFNAKRYEELCAEADKLVIDVEKVDKLYVKLIGEVQTYLEDSCEITQVCLGEASKNIKGRILSIAKDVAEKNDEIAHKSRSRDASNPLSNAEDLDQILLSTQHLVELTDQMVSFIDSQVAVAWQSINRIKASAMQMQTDILNEIDRLSRDTCRTCAENVILMVRYLCGKGVLFGRREYLHVLPSTTSKVIHGSLWVAGTVKRMISGNGEDPFEDLRKVFSPEEVGLKPFLQNLHLSKEDSDMLKANISAAGAVRVYPKIFQWIGEIDGEMIGILTEALEQVKQLIDDTSDVYSGSGEEKQQAEKELQKSLEAVRASGELCNAEVLPLFSEAAELMKDDSEDTAKMRKDLMHGLQAESAKEKKD